jgi:hypothetical protein
MSIPRPHAPRIAGNNQILYTWREPEDFFTNPITHYKLTVTQNGQSREFITDLMIIGQVVTDLEPKVPLNVTVCASVDDGQTWGPEAVFEPITPLEVPKESLTNVAALATGRGIATITWTASVEVNAFLHIQTETENPDVLRHGHIVHDIQSGSAEFPGLDPNSVYRFSVKLRNAAGEGPATLTNSVDFTGFPVPTE